MTTGPTDEESTTAAGGPGGMPLALRLSEGLGPSETEKRMKFEHCDKHHGAAQQGLACKRIRNDDGTVASQEQIWALMEHLQAENLRLHMAAEKARGRFQRILDEPSNTMSDAKALREILRQAKLGIAGS